MMLGAVGGLLSGGLGLMQGLYQAQVAKNNARIANWNAGLAEQKAQIEQQDKDRENRGALGTLIAEQGASGIAITSPSTMDTRGAAAQLARQDALRIRQAGDIESWNFKQQAADFKAQAGADTLGGVANFVGGILGGVKSLVGGSSQFAGKWDWMKQGQAYG